MDLPIDLALITENVSPRVIRLEGSQVPVAHPIVQTHLRFVPLCDLLISNLWTFFLVLIL